MSIVSFAGMWFVGGNGVPLVRIDSFVFLVQPFRDSVEFVRVSHPIQILCYRPVLPFMSDEIALLEPRESSSNCVRILADSSRNLGPGERLISIRVQICEYLLGDTRTVRKFTSLELFDANGHTLYLVC